MEKIEKVIPGNSRVTNARKEAYFIEYVFIKV